MLESTVVTHGAPTLARLKLGSLFSISRDSDFEAELARLNALFEPKGVVLTVLREKEGRALLYLYRERDLESALRCLRIQAFLKECGYRSFQLENVLAHLRERLAASEEFPHEIGIFLGSNECEALRAFARFRKCKEVYGRQFASGRPLSQLTVRSRTA